MDGVIILSSAFYSSIFLKGNTKICSFYFFFLFPNEFSFPLSTLRCKGDRKDDYISFINKYNF